MSSFNKNNNFFPFSVGSEGQSQSEITNSNEINPSLFEGVPGKVKMQKEKLPQAKNENELFIKLKNSLGFSEDFSQKSLSKVDSKGKDSNLNSNLNSNQPENSKIGNSVSGSMGRQEVVSITYEEIGLFPRSFSRVLDRFLKQVFSDVENLVIQEYRFYRYLFLTTLKCLLILILVPLFVNFLAKTYVVKPLTEYFWNTKQTEIFLNSYQQKRAFSELKEFEEKTYFESLIFPKSVFKPDLHFSGTSSDKMIEPMSIDVSEKNLLNLPKGASFDDNLSSAQKGSDYAVKHLMDVPTKVMNLAPCEEIIVDQTFSATKKCVNVPEVEIANASVPLNVSVTTQDEYKQTESLINSYTMKSSLFVYQTQEADKNIQQRYQEKTIELAQRYNDQSIEAITNFFADLISLFTLFYLLYALEIQINITKSFLLEVFFGLDDSKKSLLILLITDLLVGYHSSNLWELFFEFLFHHYGLPESQTGIFLLVATLPVLLDVLFKYLIFRHLNRSSPATVATYHAMIE